MRHLILVFCLSLAAFAFSSSVSAQETEAKTKAKSPTATNEQIIADIRNVLDVQVASWNKGDIDGFMAGYWKSEKMVFISGDSVTKGWQGALDRYKRNYNTREKMGTLTFSDLEFNVLTKTNVVVIGRWMVTKANESPKGRFTLIFRKVKEGWRIVHDHTSSG